MDALALKLNPLSKLKIYQAVRKIVMAKMNGNNTTPERAMEIIKYTKAEIVKIKTADEAIKFSSHLVEKYPELRELESAFEMETMERYDKVITNVVDIFMEKNEVATVDEILESMKKKMSESEKRELLTDLQKKYPAEYESAMTKTINSQE